jgi:hypothetical protein
MADLPAVFPAIPNLNFDLDNIINLDFESEEIISSCRFAE